MALIFKYMIVGVKPDYIPQLKPGSNNAWHVQNYAAQRTLGSNETLIKAAANENSTKT
jgi:hypothetical protein